MRDRFESNENYKSNYLSYINTRSLTSTVNSDSSRGLKSALKQEMSTLYFLVLTSSTSILDDELGWRMDNTGGFRHGVLLLPPLSLHQREEFLITFSDKAGPTWNLMLNLCGYLVSQLN